MKHGKAIKPARLGTATNVPSVGIWYSFYAGQI